MYGCLLVLPLPLLASTLEDEDDEVKLGSAPRRSAMKRLVGMVEMGRKREVAPGRRRGSGLAVGREETRGPGAFDLPVQGPEEGGGGMS